LLAWQRERDPVTTPEMRREVANLQEALAWLCRAGRWDEGARFAAVLAVLCFGDPDPGLTEHLRRLAPERVTTRTEALRALAAGTGEFLRSHFAEADRLLDAVLEQLPATDPMRWPALQLRMSNSMFQGRVDDVHRDGRALAEDPAAPVWAAAQGPCCAALISLYVGDLDTARAWLERYPERLARDLDGFIAFTRAELLSGTDPQAALRRYDEALAASTRMGQTYIVNIAGIGRAAVLIRLRRHAAAVAACRDLIGAVRSAGMTAQVWTILRLSAELLAGLGDLATAAAVLTAADQQPVAPVVMGPDRERHAGILRRAAAAGVTVAPGHRDSAALAATVLAALDRHA
jgi:hypothetical protein